MHYRIMTGEYSAQTYCQQWSLSSIPREQNVFCCGSFLYSTMTTAILQGKTLLYIFLNQNNLFCYVTSNTAAERSIRCAVNH
jgi:hypothetical protein